MADPGGANSVTYLIAVLISNFLTLAVSVLIQIYRENRKRRWDEEDRERARRDFEDSTRN